MDFLNSAAAQLRELFRSMTPGARITAGLLLAVVVVSLVYLFNYQVSGPDTYLMGGEPFAASHVPAMEAAFAKAGLGEYQLEGNRVRVPRGQHAAYMGALADAGALPPSLGGYLEKALASDNLFEGKREKMMRLKVAKQNELALILRTMNGIENASVLYDVQEGKGLAPRDIVTATVSVKPMGSEPLEPSRVPMIRKLVAGAIAGLKPEGVTVADLNGRTYAGGGEAGMGDPMDDPYYSLKKYYEQQLEQKLGESLVYVPGVVVQVSADLDTELSHREETVKHDPKTIPLRTRVKTSTQSSENEQSGGRPGLAAQGPAGGAAQVSTRRGNRTEAEDTDEETQNMVSTERVSREIKGLTPKRVKVTVVIPSHYYRQVWNERNKSEEGEQAKPPETKDLEQIEADVKKNIENAIVTLLPPVSPGTDPYPQVTVTTFQSLSQDPLLPPTMSATAVAWVGQHWSTLGLTGLAFFSLVMLRSMIKAVPMPEPSVSGQAPALSIVAHQEEEVEERSSAGRLRRQGKGPSLQDDLSEMVREDPDAAATILRNWIGNAG